MHDCSFTDTGTNGGDSARYRDAHHEAANGAVSSFDGSSHTIHNNNNNNRSLVRTENLLRLALKKPPAWQWELTTSSSSPNISFPKIQLFDSTSGELMVEVNQPDCLIRSATATTTTADGEHSEPTGTPSPPTGRGLRRSLTWLAKERVPTSGDSLTDIFRQLHSKGLGHKLSTSGSQYRLSENGEGEPEMKPATPPDRQPAKLRRRSRRSLASRSNSILGRTSGRKSTDEDDEDIDRPAGGSGVTIEEVVDEAPTPPPPRPKIYKLVRSNAGTLMVREESFHTQRSLRRRQPIHPATTELASEPDRPADVDRPIDELLSRVMLSHELRTTEETPDIGRMQQPHQPPQDEQQQQQQQKPGTSQQEPQEQQQPAGRSQPRQFLHRRTLSTLDGREPAFVRVVRRHLAASGSGAGKPPPGPLVEDPLPPGEPLPTYADAIRGGPPNTPTESAADGTATAAAELSPDTRRRWRYYARKHHSRSSFDAAPQ
ncbi:protein bassoon [Anopheles cruzii]|uniref:protein bassoon n=1 Tax=Anopheles cruzii TaxID=68878 RepID=UPI0022EC96D5|nr:protein bassoon [Anopheles cruzii]